MPTKQKIAFDIDGTLETYDNGPRLWLHENARKFAQQGHDVIVWSGGGVPYAENYVKKHGLPARVCMKAGELVNIAFDDMVDSLSGADITIRISQDV